MKEKISSEGQCLFCKGRFSQSAIHLHVQKHLAEKQGKAGNSFLLKVEVNPDWGKTPFFLSLWADGETRMKDIDGFLRSIWLECCGHMSEFTVPMSKKLKDVLHKGMSIGYQYDFGSTTELQIEVVDEYPVMADEKIALLSRNEPLNIPCCMCKMAAATVVCIAHDPEEDAEFCKACAKKHAKNCDDFEDYASMPLVNSPRMGVCGYTGGTIDGQRDLPIKAKISKE